MQILLTIAIAAPLVALACFLKAKKETKIDNCPTAIRASLLDANEDKSWNLS